MIINKIIYNKEKVNLLLLELDVNNSTLTPDADKLLVERIQDTGLVRDYNMRQGSKDTMVQDGELDCCTVQDGA